MKKILLILTLSLFTLSCEQEDFEINVNAVDDITSTAKNVAFDINLLDNDEGKSITLRSIESSSNSVIVDNVNGSITYTPNTNFVGEDVIKYSIEDIFGAVDNAFLKVTVK